MSTSQTLSRGLTALEFVALAERPPTIDSVAEHLGVHRSIAYRIVRTLEEHRLVRRDEAGGCLPGLRLGILGRSTLPTLRSTAVGELSRLADELGLTCFLVIRDGDEALTVESQEPTASHVHLTYKPGIRHPIDRGAPGLAVLAGEPERSDERTEVSAARRDGWVKSVGEVVEGLAAIAVPLTGREASIAAVFLPGAGVDEPTIVEALTRAAASIDDHLQSSPAVAS
ncbi:MAG: helix-turn-helix domain-containing protein [Actinomycetota bacterium]